MKTYIFDKIINRLKRYSEKLEVEDILCDKPWIAFNDTGEKEVFIFRNDGTVLVTLNGKGVIKEWEWVPANNSLIIKNLDKDNSIIMMHPQFIKNILLAFELDGTNEYTFLIEENNRDRFAPKSLTELKNYFIAIEQRAIEAERQRLLRQAQEEERRRQEEEWKRAQEAERRRQEAERRRQEEERRRQEEERRRQEEERKRAQEAENRRIAENRRRKIEFFENEAKEIANIRLYNDQLYTCFSVILIVISIIVLKTDKYLVLESLINKYIDWEPLKSDFFVSAILFIIIAIFAYYTSMFLCRFRVRYAAKKYIKEHPDNGAWPSLNSALNNLFVRHCYHFNNKRYCKQMNKLKVSDNYFNFGTCYYNGTYFPKNLDKATYWYKKAAKLGHVDAQYELGRSFANGEGVKQNHKMAVKWFLKAAKKGNPKAQNNLGVCYFNGSGVKQNYKKAAKWFFKSSKQDVKNAQRNLALSYNKLAEQGDADAQFKLGCCYYLGYGVSKDYYKAVICFKKGAEKGNTDAQNNLGICYYMGHGFLKDYKQAVYWLTQSAKRGNSNAIFNLASCYYNGFGVNQDYSEAVKLFINVAKQGNEEAMFNLGLCYYYGHGLDKNVKKSMYWFKKAAHLGNHFAKDALERKETFEHTYSCFSNPFPDLITHFPQILSYTKKFVLSETHPINEW